MGVCECSHDERKTSLKELLVDEEKFNNYINTSFDKVDVDKNGYLEREDLKELIQDIVNKIITDTYDAPRDKVTLAMESIDIDGDGKITKEEFIKTSRDKLLANCFNCSSQN